MKLRLNTTLRRCLLAAFAAVATLSTGNIAQGSILYSSVGMQTYTDFGQNCGRYQAGRVNDLLSSIRQEEKGIRIYYYGDKFEGYSFTLPHGMIDFSSGSVGSVDAAIGYGFLATVQHNGVQNPAYAAPIVGANNAVKYAGIEYRNVGKGLGEAYDQPFLYAPHTDYKITRLSKLVTDVRPSDVYNDMDMLGQPLTGQFLYRAGSGSMKMAEVDENGIANAGEATGLRGAYSYVTGGLITIDGWGQRETQEGGDFNYSVNHTVPSDIYGYITGEQASGQVNPLPYVSQSGDSGSPSWVWNEKTGTYQYISALQSGGGTYSQDRGAWYWTLEKMESFNKRIELSDDTTLHFTAVNQTGDTISGNANDTTLTVTQHLGSIIGSGGETITTFAGVQSGVNTWNNLNDIKDLENWYAYGNEHLNANGDPSLEGSEETRGKISYGELMHTDSIILTATTESPYTVQLDDTVDTGIGFVQFSKADGVANATFNLVSEEGEQNQLNTAGFVVDAGVTLDISLTGDSNYLREWRKVGEGDLRISGSGNNDILLNVGGGSAGTNDGSNTGHASGRVLLEREGGYAAYNVLASTGSTVVLKDIGQVAHDITLGAGGATLDLNGNDYTWDNSGAADGSFTLHMLTEQDILANRGSSDVTVTIKDAGDTLLGSFEDSASGAMNIIYAGEKNLAMHSIFTKLTNADSSFTVQSGSVSLGGTVTVHGTGSLTGTNTDRVVNPNDWHYADAKMNVTVQNGATFTLDSHARLTGDVTVNGGTFVMREGTKHQMEYIEGGFFAEDTQSDFYSLFYGLKGNISLNNGALEVAYSEGADSHNTYAGNISGTASAVSFDLGTNAALSLRGNNDFTIANGGSVNLISGGVIAENSAAAGYAENGTVSHTWHIGEKAYLAVKGLSGSELLSLVTTDSTGALVLTESQTEALAVRDGLFIGALEGNTVQYGAAGTTNELATNTENQWLLGGGGGELVVNFALNNADAALVLGNAYTTGTVTLTNAANHIGSIDFKGLVTLNYTSDAALGGATINLNYGNRVLGSQGTLNLLPNAAEGTLLLDKKGGEDIDLSAHGSLYLGAADDTTYSGTVTPAGDTYRFGGSTGVLSLTQALTGDRNLSVDAQHHSGGAVELLTQAELTGAVSVMGYDSEKTQTTGGDITLRLSAEDALASAASVTLKDGGSVDINGLHQQLRNLTSELGSVLTDSSLDKTGVAEVHSTQSTTMAGDIQVARLNKTGDATLTLSGNSQAALYEVQQGTLHITSNEAMAETVVVNGGATLAASTFETGAALRLHDGATLAVDSGATLTLKHAPLMGAADTATLKGNLRFNATEDIHLTGTLSSVSKSNAALIFSSAGGTPRTREIDHLNIAADSTFTVRQESVDAAVDFRIHQLSGSGIFKLEAGNYATTPGIYTLDGANDFCGTVKLSSIQAHSLRPYNHYLVLENDKALQNAVAELNGWSVNSAHAILAVNTDNALVKGLTSGSNSAQTLVMAGTPEGVSLPSSNRAATLTITGDREYTFGGDIVGGAADTNNGLTLVMNGTGSQTLSGNSVVLQNATAQRGTLVLGAKVTVNDTYAVARGATLTLPALNLTADKTLAVLDAADGGIGNVATLNSALTLNSGTLLFSASALSQETAALGINSLTKTAGVAIGFTNTAALQTGVRYVLEGSEDWSGVSITDASQRAEYLTAGYEATNSGLYVTFTNKDGYRIWNGTSANHLWDAEHFGTDTALGETDTAVFTDNAESSTVSIGAAMDVTQIIVDSTRTYTFAASGANTLTAGSLTQQGAGTTTLGNGISVSGAAYVKNGTLELAEGSSINNATVDKGAILLLHDAANTTGSISGEGALVLDMTEGTFEGSRIGSIGSIDVQSGTLQTATALNTQSLTIGKGGTLSTTIGTFADGADTVALAGTLELAAAGNTAITTAVTADGAGLLGQLNITSGTVSVGADIAAERVSVSGGSFNICTDGNQESNGLYFLNHVGTLSVSNGATAQIGRLNYTMAKTDLPLNLEASGSGTTLKLALSQYGIGTVAGNLTLTNGAKLEKLDGGLDITGNARFGADASDRVYLWGNWGKSGIILEGEVSGNGTVELQRGSNGAAALVTLAHEHNSFEGTYQANANTRLIVAAETAAEQAAVNLLSGGKLLLGAETVTLQRVTGSGEINLATPLTTEERYDGGIESSLLTLCGTDNNFSGTVAGGVSLCFSGEGTHTFSGNSAVFDGTVTVQNGTLDLQDKGILRQAREISVAESGTLALDGMMTLTTPTIRNEGTVSFGSDTCYILGDITTPATYTLVSGSGNTTGLSLANFLYDGHNMVGYSAGVRLFTTDNAVTLRISGITERTITWNGTADSSTWDNGISANWLDDGTLATESYRLTDSVIFGEAGSKDVSIAGGTAIQNMTVASGNYSFTGMAGLTVNGTLRVEAGSSAVFDTLPAQHTARLTADGNVTAGATTVNNGTATFNGTAHFTNGLNIDGGTTTFNGAVTVDATAADYEMVINRGTVAINGAMTVNGDVQLGNNDQGAAKSLITIGEQGVLSVGKLNSAWGFNTLTVNGVLNTTHFNLSTGTTQTITGSGTINTDRLSGANAGTYNFSNLRLNIGSGGMDGSRTLSFTNMTLGALDNWTANRTIDLAGDIVIDTAKVGSESGEGTSVTLKGLNTTGLTSLTKTGAGTLLLSNNNGNSGTLIVAEGTLKLGADQALGSTSGDRIRIDSGAVLDINGLVGAVSAYTVTLNGGTLTNTGNAQGTGQRQVVTGLKLTADSAVESLAGKEFGLIASGWGATEITLSDHTLEKTGAGTYHLTNTVVSGGKLKVSEGTLNVIIETRNTAHAAAAVSADIEMAGGTLSGAVRLGKDIRMDITKASVISADFQTSGHSLTVNNDAVTSTMSGALTGAGKLVKTGAQDVTLTNGSTSFTGGAEVQQGTLRLSGNAVGMMDRLTSLSVAEDATLHLSTSGTFADKNWNAAHVLGNLELGNGTDNMTVNATAFSELNSQATLVLNKKAQYEGNGTATAPATLDNDLIFRTDATRIAMHNVDEFNGNITIEGTAVISSLQTGVNRTTTFNGSISGDTLSVGGGEWGAGQQFYVFSEKADATKLSTLLIGKSGNSNWTNVIIQGANALAQEVSFDANCDTDRGRLFIESDSGTNTLRSDANVGYIAVTQGNSFTVKDSTDFGGKIELGSVRNANGNALQTAYVAVSGKDKLTTMKADGELTLSADEAKQEATIAGDGKTVLADTLIDLAAGTTLHLKDVVLADSSRLTDAPGASVDMTNVTVQAVKGSNFVAADAPITLESGSTLTANGNSGATMTVAATTSCNSFTLGNIDSLHLTGDSMTIALSGYSYEELLGLNKMLSITLGNNADFDNSLQVLLTVGSAEDTERFYTLLGYHQGDGGSGTLFFDLSATIPEPTTGTLSLLALAALCARRRRK